MAKAPRKKDAGEQTGHKTAKSVEANQDGKYVGVYKSAKGQQWVFSDIDDALSRAISQTHGLDEIIGKLLAARKISLADVEKFLEPKIQTHMPDPFVMQDMEKAAKRIADAIMKGEKVTVFGDYDVDGATSSALLARYFRAVGHDIDIYIPDRIDEGYGPNSKALKQLKEEGNDLVITVDCGVMAHEPLKAAKDVGLQTIVLDHHMSDGDLPPAYAIVNPNRKDDISGLGDLAAVGVTYMTLVAVNRELRKAGWFENRKEPRLYSLLDIVALGTVCDVVPLRGLNRAFVAQGLKVLQKTTNIGLRALMEAAGVHEEVPNVHTLGFRLGPRINAGGRVGKSDLGAVLLSTKNGDDALKIAATLDKMNADRQNIEKQVLQEAIAQVEASPEMKDSNIILVANKDWHPGVIGIVASRLKDKYHKPVAVISLDENGKGKASARSMPQVHFGQMVLDAKKEGILLEGGGHRMAAGFSVKEDKIEQLRKYMHEHIEKQLDGQEMLPEVEIDDCISPSAVNLHLADTLLKVGPYGAGNSEPRFVLTGAKIVNPRIIGNKADHMMCIITDSAGGGSLKALAFNIKDTEMEKILFNSQGRSLLLSGHIRINVWQGQRSVQFEISDVALGWQEKPEMKQEAQKKRPYKRRAVKKTSRKPAAKTNTPK